MHLLCSIDWERAARVSSSLLTPIIAIIALWIAWQQNVTRRRQVRVALFDKRLAVFNSTMKLVSAGVRNAKIELDELFAFLADTRETEFLFGEDILKYVDEVYNRCLELHTKAQQGRAATDTELLKWFVGQSNEAKRRFGKYLSLPKP